jgi:predicted AlkP superfamily pyrophosphatase or phosphodiesterase
MKNHPIVVGLLSLCIYFACRCESAPAAAPVVDPDRIVVLMSIDGLANFYMDDPAAEMPTIRKLAAEGAKASSMRASDPTVTWPNHTTLVTGVSPARHGVVGNNWFDRVKGEKVTLIWDPVLDKDEIVKVPTIYDLAKAAGLKTAAIKWPATRNAHSLDWTCPDVGKAELVSKYTTPALLDECKQAGYDVVYGDEGKTVSRGESIAKDEMWTHIFNMILHNHRPNLALLHVIAVDHTEHVDGPRSDGAYETVKAADGQVREVWEELQKDFPGKATLIIVSDHGFSANKKKVVPFDALEKAGLVEMSGKRVTGGAVQLVVQGGSALVYVSDEANRDAVIKQVKKAFAHVEGVAKVVTPDEFAEYGIGDSRRDPHAPDMLLEAKLGYYFGDTAAGGKTEHKGSHGHDSHLPELHAMFVASGDGIKPGTNLGEIDNRSVAPTIAKLLGIEMPTADGKPLTEALAE